MTLEQALDLVAQACAEYRGTLAQHQSLQTALAIIQAAVTKAEPEKGEVG